MESKNRSPGEAACSAALTPGMGEGESTLGRKNLRLSCDLEQVLATFKGALVHLPMEEPATGRNSQGLVSLTNTVFRDWQGLPG